ncbi:MAG TPA: pilus assembly protein [Paraburkholderia sp.]|jgi:Flp pilus assembly protein TadD|nr:pilus assembly protein [Paraburkholderia sp.]
MGLSIRLFRRPARYRALVPLLCALTGACSVNPAGYGVGPQAERAALQQQGARDPAPDTPGMYLALIDRMQAQGLYYASLAHIDAYDRQYGASPDSILLRADALRATDQTAASVAEYTKLLDTPLAARAYRGLGLLAGAGGDFHTAAEALGHAALLAPTDAATLSDLGYARLRAGDIAGARVPLLKAAELDSRNQKIVGNVVLYLSADGQGKRAQALMNEQKLSPAVRARIRDETVKVLAAASSAPAPQRDAHGTPPVASVRNSEPVEPLLQRFAQ